MPDKYSNEQKGRKTSNRKAEKTNVESEAFFPQPRNEIFIEFGKKVSQEQIHAFEKEICERVVCLPLCEKMREEAESQGYHCKAEVFNGNLKIRNTARIWL